MLILASNSPRRRELLARLGVEFQSVGVEVDESKLPNETPQQMVRRVAASKAEAAAEWFPDRPILAGDTIVVAGDSVMGKPADQQEARAMLTALSGKRHEVFSGVALHHNDETVVTISQASVWMDILDPERIEAYIGTTEPMDRAGAYAIQGLGGALVARIEGDFYAIMGFPLREVLGLLNSADIAHLL